MARLLWILSLLSFSAAHADPSPSPAPQTVEERLAAVEKELARLRALASAPPPPTKRPHRESSEVKDVPWYAQITWNAFISTSYTWNFDRPASGINRLRAFDYQNNSFVIDAAELVIQKPVVNKGDFGFRADVVYGAVAEIGAARGLFRDPLSSKPLSIDLQQAILSYVIPIGTGLRVDFGKFVTPLGSEYLDGYDGWNDNFSRSILFNWSGPFTHTGFKFTYTFNPKLMLSAMLVNGWDNVIDNNAAKSFGLMATVTPHPTLNLYINYVGGPERDNNDTDFRHYVDFGLVWKPMWRLMLMINYDFGWDPNAVTQPSMVPGAAAVTSNALWTGVAAYLRLQLHKRFGVIGRAEWFWDRDGYRTGTAQTVGEVTFTPEVTITTGLLFRVEARYDISDQHYFENSTGGTRKDQTTLAINGLYSF
jgi:hypothetical protein